MHPHKNQTRLGQRRWGQLLLIAGLMALGPRAQANTVEPTLVFQGPVTVAVTDADGQGVNFDLRALGDVYLDLSRMTGRFQHVTLAADHGHIALDPAATDLWPHTGANTQAAADEEIVAVWGDAQLLPEDTWSGASFSLLAADDLYVYGGSFDVESLRLEASTLLINGSSGAGPVHGGQFGGATIVGNPSVGADGDITFVTGDPLVGEFGDFVTPVVRPGGEITIVGGAINIDEGGGVTIIAEDITLVPLPAGIWLLGGALFSLAGWARRRRTA